MIAAHPDDIEACAGGLVAKLTEQNTQVFYVIVTNGDKGCGAPFCMNWSSEHLAMVRQQEAIQAAKVLGVAASHVTLLDYEDGQVTSYPEVEIREDLVRTIRSIQPDVVMTWFPYPNFKLLPSAGWSDLGYHPDHQAVGKLVLDSVFDSGIRLLFPLAGPAWSPSFFFMWEFLNPTHYTGLSDDIMNKKIASYEAHKTQYPSADQVVQGVKTLGYEVAQNANVSDTYAEGFIAFY